ncbi:MAG: hypothetical protein K6F09_03120 [Clostridiales bacterium]|nr:hypothetical protein [Clostridiales bacterium]
MKTVLFKISALFTAAVVWLSTLFGGGFGKVTPITEKNSNIPILHAGIFQGGFKSSGSTVIDKYICIRAKDYEKYTALLEKSGYTLYDSRKIENNSFSTYTNDKYALNLSFYPHTGIMRIAVEEKGTMCLLSDPCDKVCDTLLTGMKGETVVAEEGMGFIIRLNDGSFCIIDGGMGDPDGVDADKLMNILLEQKPENVEKPVIASWIFTHLHGDHIGVFNCFSLKHHADVEIERLIYNFPKEEETAASDSPYMLDDTIYRYTQFKKNLAEFYPDVPVLKVHTGNRFEVRNAHFDVLFTLEDLYPLSILNGGMNESSLLLKMTVDGQTTLWTGDFGFNSAKTVLKEFSSETLSSDILQLAHHGINGTVKLYSAIDPTYCLLPVWEGGLDKMLEKEQNKWLVNSPKVKQFIVTANGTWTIHLPYEPAEGKYVRIPSDDYVNPSYPVLLGE